MPLLIYSVVYFAIVILVSLSIRVAAGYGGEFHGAVENCALVILSVAAIVGLPVHQQRHGRLSECAFSRICERHI